MNLQKNENIKKNESSIKEGKKQNVLIKPQSQYQKKAFSSKFRNNKKQFSNRRLQDKEDRKQKRKFKRKFILPESLSIDGYKTASNLTIFVTKYGKIERRKANKLKGKKYRKITRSIKNMRILGFIPFLKK